MSYLTTARKTKARLSGQRLDTDHTEPGQPTPPEALGADDPVLTVEQWYPEFHKFRLRVTAEASSFDYAQIRKERPDLYRLIRTKEAEIDALEAARLSEVMAIMSEWRRLILEARANHGSADFTLPGVQARPQRRV